MEYKRTQLDWQSWIEIETGNLILYFEDNMHGDDIWIEWRPDGAYLREWGNEDEDTLPKYTPINDLRAYMAEAISKY